MTDLLKILEEHIELLRERGYAGIGIEQSKDPDIFIQGLEEIDENGKSYEARPDVEKPGLFTQQLEQIFSDQIKEAQFKKSVREFEVRSFGFFNDDKDIIDFLFHYQLDPRKGTIEMKSFKAEMDGVAKMFVLEGTMYNLPPVSAVISILSGGTKILQTNTVPPPQNKNATDYSIYFKNTLNDHCQILMQKGYTNKEHFPYSENFLFKKLEHKLKNKYSDVEATPEFLIRMQGFFGGQDDELKYNFFYSINRTDHLLQLNAMVAELNDKRTGYSLKQEGDLPPAADVWKHLTNALVEEGVRVIYPKEELNFLLREQEDILGGLGYYKTFLDNRSNFIYRELQGLLQKNLNGFECRILPINRRIHLNLNDTMYCRFEYLFDPLNFQLTLKAISAKMSALERQYSLKDIQAQNLNLQKIAEELKEQNRLLKARKISEGPAGRSGMTAMLKHLQKRP